MKKNNGRRIKALAAACLLILAGYCWVKILAPRGPVVWLMIEAIMPLEYSRTEFPATMIRRAIRDTAWNMGIAYDPKLPLPRIFVLPPEDMEEIFGDRIIAGVYFHHPLMQPKIFVVQKKRDYLTGQEIVRGILRYLNDTYPDEFDIRRIPFLERKMARAYQAC